MTESPPQELIAASFLITTHGDGAGAQLVQGWAALCEAIVDTHYFEPDGLQRDEVLARVTAWDDWQSDDTGPYFLALDYEDGSVSITRVTDARELLAAEERGASRERERCLDELARTAFAPPVAQPHLVAIQQLAQHEAGKRISKLILTPPPSEGERG